jgi:hypothetical protein
MLDKDRGEGPLVCYRLCHLHNLCSLQRTGQMITDSCRPVYVIVDDLIKGLAPHLRRPGPAPVCSDLTA